MAKDEFLTSVRTTVGMLLPSDLDHPYPDWEKFEGILRGSRRRWLSEDSVSGFDHADFNDLEPKMREVLDRDVATFLKLARQVDAAGHATPEQVEAAVPTFVEIAEIVRDQTRNDWLKAARGLIDQATRWAEAEKWPTERYSWEFDEPFLGTYELDRLIYAVMGSQMALVPVGRFTMKSKGSFDLAVMPAYESVSISRLSSGRWSIEPLPGDNRALTWKQPHFVEVSKKLARMG